MDPGRSSLEGNYKPPKTTNNITLVKKSGFFSPTTREVSNIKSLKINQLKKICRSKCKNLKNSSKDVLLNSCIKEISKVIESDPDSYRREPSLAKVRISLTFSFSLMFTNITIESHKYECEKGISKDFLPESSSDSREQEEHFVKEDNNVSWLQWPEELIC